MRNLLPIVCLASCAPPFPTVDEACDPGFVGDEKLPDARSDYPTANDVVGAVDRINCWRRVSEVSKLNVDTGVQLAANSVVNYIKLNPDVNILGSDSMASFFLNQDSENPGYFGANLYQRLEAAEYSLAEPLTTASWEVLYFEFAASVEELPATGAAEIDELMRYPMFRQAAQQPSVKSSAYATAELGRDWWCQGGGLAGVFELPEDQTLEQYCQGGEGGVAEGDLNFAPVGRVYYLNVLYTSPHIENAGSPVLLPNDPRGDDVLQTDVPLYSWSENLDVVDEAGAPVPVQISWPITLLMGAIDPANYSFVDQNRYNAVITNASISGPDGPIETEAVMPGDDGENVWPDGRFLRTTLAVYTREPFLPNSSYTLFALYTTPEGEFELELPFVTAGEDPGLIPGLGGNTAARSVRRFPPVAQHGLLGASATSQVP